MADRTDALLRQLSTGPRTAAELCASLGVSQPTLSRDIAALGDRVVRLGATRASRYALRDDGRGLPPFSIHRVDPAGQLMRLGTLTPVRPDGFVMRQEDGVTLHSDGLPWWLLDMRPQGYLGRAWAARHGAALGLPARLTEWSDTHALRALLAQGHDAVGNLLLGDAAREDFLTQPAPSPIPDAQRAKRYAQLAREASQGEVPGSSAGGEQPKFTTCVATPEGPVHVIVKFTEGPESPVTERWRDLLLAEHLALQTLREGGVPAARTRLLDHAGQRFLEVWRFDRVGTLGRRALISLSALDAEFVGAANEGWPVMASRLASARHITADAARGAALLWAFGTLIGNSDMHGGNLSFMGDDGRPYALAPAYDMSPMAFAPRSSGALPDRLLPAAFSPAVPNATWRDALTLAQRHVATLASTANFSPRFAPALAALQAHVAQAAQAIARMG